MLMCQCSKILKINCLKRKLYFVYFLSCFYRGDKGKVVVSDQINSFDVIIILNILSFKVRDRP